MSPASSHLSLCQFKGLLINNPLVMVFHIVLFELAFVDDTLVRKEIRRIAFLQKPVPFVLLILKNRDNRGLVPPLLSAGCLPAKALQLPADCVAGKPI